MPTLRVISQSRVGIVQNIKMSCMKIIAMPTQRARLGANRDRIL